MKSLRLRILLALVLLAGGVSLLVAHSVNDPPSGESGYVARLATYTLRVPKGTHFISWPLVPAQAGEATELFGPDLAGLDRVEVWDPAAGLWKPYWRRDLGLAPGARSIPSTVARVWASQPTLVTLRGTPLQGDWKAYVVKAARGDFFGAFRTDAVPVGEIARALEQGGDFLLGRDSLYYWDLAAGSWTLVSPEHLDVAVDPCTAFWLQPPGAGSASGRLPTYSASASMLEAPQPLTLQNPVPLTAAYDDAGDRVDPALYTQTGQPWAGLVTPTYALDGFRYRDLDGKHIEGLASMHLPRELLRMTDLPPVAPVRIGFTPKDEPAAGSPPRPYQYELLGIKSMRIGGSTNYRTITPMGSSPANYLQLVVDASGNLMGHGRTNLSAIRGALPGGTEAVACTSLPVSVYFTPRADASGDVTVTYDQPADPSKPSRDYKGPFLDVAVSLNPAVRTFWRWGTSDARVPDLDRCDAVNQWTLATKQPWVEYDKSVGQILTLHSNDTDWNPGALPATLRTTDGLSISSVDGANVTSATINPFHISFPWGINLDFVKLPVLACTQANPRTVCFASSGLARLWTGDRTSIAVWQNDAVFMLHDPDDKFELSLRFAVTLDTNRNLGGSHAFKINPVITFRAASSDLGGDVKWGETIVFLQPKVDVGLDLKKYFDEGKLIPFGLKSIAALTRFVAAVPARLWSKDAANKVGFDFASEWWDDFKKNAKEFWKDDVSLESYGGSLGLATDFTFSGEHRVCLYGTGSINYPKTGLSNKSSETTRAANPDCSYEFGGAYAKAGGTAGSGGLSGVAISYSGGSKGGGSALGGSEFSLMRATVGFTLPDDWGWSGQTATGVLERFQEKLADSRQTERLTFRATELLSFRHRIDAIPAFDVGDGKTDLSIDLSDLDVTAEVSTKGTQVTRRRTYHGSLFAGTVAEGTTTSSSFSEDSTLSDQAKGFQLDLTRNWRQTGTASSSGQGVTTGSNAPSTPVTNAPAILPLGLFGDDGIAGVQEDAEWLGELDFHNIGDTHFRMNSLRGIWRSRGQRSFAISMGFRPQTTGTWAEASGTLECNPSDSSWRFLAEVRDLDLGQVQLEDAYLGFGLDHDEGFKDVFTKARLGGLVKFGATSGALDTAKFRIGADLDLRAKQGALTLGLPGRIFCHDSDDCPMTATDLDGSIDWSGPTASTQFSLTCLCKPGWMNGKSCTVSAACKGKPWPEEISLSTKNLIPSIPLPMDGSFIITELDVGYNRTTKIVNYGGQTLLNLPRQVVTFVRGIDLGVAKLSMPDQITATFAAKNKKASVLAEFGAASKSSSDDYSQKLGLVLFNTIKVGLDSFNYTMASPWQLAMKGVLSVGQSANATTYPLDIAFDSQKKQLAFTAPPDAKIKFSIDSAAFEVSRFSLTIYDEAGIKKLKLGGDAKVTVAGASYAGGLDLRLGSDTSVTATLSTTAGDGTAIPTIPGIEIQPLGISISSTVHKKDDGSTARTMAVTGGISITLDAGMFGPLGGHSMTAQLSYDSEKNVVLTVEDDLPTIALQSGGVGLPFAVSLKSLKIVRKAKTQETLISGQAALDLLRPINTIFGARGDQPFTIDAELGVDSKSNKTSVYFEGKFNPQMCVNFSELGARGSLTIPGVKVDTEGDLSIRATLALVSPVKSTLTLIATDDKGKITFSVTADPRLKIDLSPLFKLDFQSISYTEDFPGFMGLGLDLALNVGVALFGIGVDFQDFLYILPSSFPPVGFPFFEEIASNARFFGFSARASIANPKPQLGFADAITLVKDLAKGLPDPTNDDRWADLRDFLKSKLQGSTAILRGPGIGNLALGLPMILREVIPQSQFPTETWFADNPTLALTVISINLWNGMHYVSDLFPASELASGLVETIKVGALVCKAFSDPIYLVNLIPPAKRDGGFDLNLAGIAAASAHYHCLTPKIFMDPGSSALLPAFADLSALADWADNSADPKYGGSGLPAIPSVIRARASYAAPYAVNNVAFSWANCGKVFAGIVNDAWLPLRPFVEAALEHNDYASPADAQINIDHAIGLHLKRLVDEKGGLTQVDGKLVTPDGLNDVQLMGSTARFKVENPEGKAPLFWGTVMLGSTATVQTPAGDLELKSGLAFEGKKLRSSVTARLQPKGRTDWRDLGEVSKSTLKDLEAPAMVASPSEGNIAGWIVDYALDDKGAMQLRYTDYGTAKFVAPHTEFTSVYPGAVLSDMRALLSALDRFKGMALEAQSSPYALGLKIWSSFLNDPAFQRKIDKITTDGRTVRITFKDPESGALLEMRIVLESLSYYLGEAPQAPLQPFTEAEPTLPPEAPDPGPAPAYNPRPVIRPPRLPDTDLPWDVLDGPMAANSVALGLRRADDITAQQQALQTYRSSMQDYEQQRGIVDPGSAAYRASLAIWTQKKAAFDNYQHAKAVHDEWLQKKTAADAAEAQRTAERDQAQTRDLSAASDISSFSMEDRRLLAEPFMVQVGGGKTQVRELVVFDGSKAVADFLARCEEQKQALQQTDLQRFAELGLSISGDPLIVHSLRVELDVGQVRSTLRPGSILISRIVDGLSLVDIRDAKTYADLQAKGPYQDASLYPGEPHRWMTVSSVASQATTAVVTTPFDLYQAMGTNVLLRSYTVTSPDTLAGVFVEMKTGLLQGSLNVGGARVTVEESDGKMTGKSTFTNAAGTYSLAISRSPNGSLDAVANNGEDRVVAFEYDRTTGHILPSFTYPNGKVEPGGFTVDGHLALQIPSVVGISLDFDGEIKAGGYFHFFGEVDTQLFGRSMSEEMFDISSNEGLYISGKWNLILGNAVIEGRVHAKRGASFYGSLRILPGGTGIDASVSIDTNARPNCLIRGDVKIANHTIVSQTFSLDANTIRANWSVGGSWAGVGLDLGFTRSGATFSIHANARAWLRLLFFTVRVSAGVDISTDGSADAHIGRLHCVVNIPRGSFSVHL